MILQGFPFPVTCDMEPLGPSEQIKITLSGLILFIAVTMG